MIKTLFMTGTRVAEFVHIQVKDLHLDADPPQIYTTHASYKLLVIISQGVRKLLPATAYVKNTVEVIRNGDQDHNPA